MNDRVKLIGATALLLGGGALIAWRFVEFRPHKPLPPEHARQHEAPSAPPEGASPIERDAYMTPTAESLHTVVDQATAHLRRVSIEQGGETFLSHEQTEVLLDMFTDHFEYALSGPDVHAYDTWISEHGGGSGYARAIADGHERAYRRDMEGRAQYYKLIAFAPERSEILPRYQNGVLIPWDRRPVVTMYTEPNTFALPMDAEKAGLTVYEIRVPAMVPGSPADPVTGAPVINTDEIYIPGVLGFAYAWDEQREQWLPWRNWVYCVRCDGREFYDGPNFP